MVGIAHIDGTLEYYLLTGVQVALPVSQHRHTQTSHHIYVQAFSPKTSAAGNDCGRGTP